MSQFYSPQRTYNLYDPVSNKPYRLSRYKIELFISCPFCFYMDVRCGIAIPSSIPLALNRAVDKLLKKEFDIHRAKASRHPLMKHYKIDAVPFQHKNINQWRNSKIGISYHHQPTNFIIYGGIDDVWIKKNDELIIVDYKATSKNSTLSIDANWQKTYKRQMELYQWLFRRNGFKVSEIGYFVYCNGITDKEAFDGKLEFDIEIIPYKGHQDWIEPVLFEIKRCLSEDKIPLESKDCDFCKYRLAVEKSVNKFKPKLKKLKKAGLKASGQRGDDEVLKLI